MAPGGQQFGFYKPPLTELANLAILTTRVAKSGAKVVPRKTRAVSAPVAESGGRRMPTSATKKGRRQRAAMAAQGMCRRAHKAVA